jgi:hypothetical protein
MYHAKSHHMHRLKQDDTSSIIAKFGQNSMSNKAFERLNEPAKPKPKTIK